MAGTSSAANAKAYQVNGSWESATIQWSNMPTIGTVLDNNISHNNKTKYEFSCLTAVQHWYDGSTTGQNENYGIMLKYADDTVADYNSVYSADCTDATMRPSMTISYTPGNSSYSVNEGETLALPITRAAGVVTWVSSDSTIATVNSNGVVAGIKAGEITVTAYMDGNEYQAFTVYVTVANGVYRFRNSNGYYLGTYGEIAENTSVKLLGNASSGFYQVCQLWKVTYLSDGYYSIRPLHKLDMGLHANGYTNSDVNITSVGTSDTLSGVSSLNRWGIVRNSSGDAYNLNHVNSISLGLRAEGYTPSAGMNVTIASNSSDLSYFNWSLVKIDDPPSGVLLYDIETDKVVTLPSRHISISSSATLADIGLAVNVYSGGSSAERQMIWTTEDGTGCLVVNRTTGTMVGMVCGTTLLTGTSEYGIVEIYVTVTGTPSTDFALINHYDSTFLQDPEMIGFINEAVDIVNTAYQRQFGVTISSSGLPYYREQNIVASCPNGNNVSCHDNDLCGTDCDSVHHKNKYVVADSLYESYSGDIPENHVLVFWTNHELGTYCSEGGKSNYSLAGVYHHRPVIHFMSIPDGETETEYENARLMCMVFVLAHEFTHTLGMEDYYSSKHGDEEKFDCVMEGYPYKDPKEHETYFKLVKEGKADLFCSSCEAILSEFLLEAIGQ